MIKYFSLSLFSILLVSCVNVYQKPAALGNRSVITMQSTEGENAWAQRHDSTDSVAADKVNENTSDTAISGTGDVTNTPASKSNAATTEQKTTEKNEDDKSPSNIEVPVESAVEASAEENIPADDLNR